MSRWICLLFIACFACAESKEKTICLNMIVKDESAVIERCLSSVKSLIDYWVIVDTGSSDNTRELIKNCMKGIPGELHERPWVDFAYNRNEALKFAKNKGDYVLLIDADEVLQFSEDFRLPPLEKDLYFIPVRQVGAVDFKRNGLLNNHLEWKWEGVCHEVVTCLQAKSKETLKGVINLCNTHPEGSSGRSKDLDQTAKYARDAEILEKAFQKEPNNSRYAYYLGISYSAAEKYELAQKAFEKRLSLPSADLHETFLAFCNLGSVQEKRGDLDAALDSFSKASFLFPMRAEPLFRSAVIYRKKGQILVGYLLAQYALTLPYPNEDPCVEYVVYDHSLLIEFANCALLLQKYQEGLNACNKLLANPSLPSEYKSRVLANRELALKNLAIEN